MSDDRYTGPVGFAVFSVPAGADLTPVTEELRRLAVTHGAEILDVELVSADGGVARAELPEELASIETDLLDADDLAVIVGELNRGENALVVIYEDRTLASLADRIDAAGGRELLTGGIAAADIAEKES